MISDHHLEITSSDDEELVNLHKCPHCKVLLDPLENMADHLRRQCSLLRNHICQYCGSRFFRHHHLQRHIRHIHQSPAPQMHKCDKCDKSYKRKEHLRRHLQYECGVEPKFQCNTCNYKCKHKSSLVCHMKSCISKSSRRKYFT